MKKISYIFGIAALLGMSACSNEDAPTPAPVDPIAPVEDIVLPEANLSDISAGDVAIANDFSVRLFKAAYSEAKDKNICLSPTSVMAVLSMLANGDTAESRDEILKMIGYDTTAEGLKKLNETNYIYLTALPETDRENVEITFSNSIWHPEDVEIQPNFLNILNQYYNGENILKSSAGEVGMAAINAFVNEKTHGLIPDFLKAPLINSEALLNTTYLKAKWTNPFSEAESYRKNEFTNLDGSLSRPEYMEYDGEYLVNYIDDIYCFDIPYGNGNMSMTIFSPISWRKSFEEMVETLTYEKMAEMINGLNKEDWIFVMPEFTSEADGDMMGIFQNLGFNNDNVQNGYNNILIGKTFGFGGFIHNAKLIVNKEGSEGGAASIVGDSCGMHGPGEYYLDSPFIYVIREHSTGAIIFMGAVTSFE